MATSKVSVRGIMDRMMAVGDEDFSELLLDLVRRGPKVMATFFEKAPAGTSLFVRAEGTVAENPIRYLEAAFVHLPPGPERARLFQLIGWTSMVKALARYRADGAWSKASVVGAWLYSTANPPLSGSEHRDILLSWSEAYVETMCSLTTIDINDSSFADDVELILLECGANLYLAKLYLSQGRLLEFAQTTLLLAKSDPSIATGPLGQVLAGLIIEGSFQGGSLPLPSEDVIWGLAECSKEKVRATMQSHFESVGQELAGLIRHTDAIQEWNEWFLTGYGFGPEVVAQKILDEAGIAHRRSIALTRYLQTFEEPELVHADTYALFLEILGFAGGDYPFSISLDLERGLPEVLCDERQVKIAVLEFLACLDTDLDGVSKVAVVSRPIAGWGVEVTMQVYLGCEHAESVLEAFLGSLSHATMDRVMSSHSGRISTGRNSSGFVVSLAFNSGHNDVGFEATDKDWTAVVLGAAKAYELELSGEITQILSFLVHDMKNAFSFIQSWAEGFRGDSKEALRSVSRIRENISRVSDAARDAETLLSLNSEARITYEDLSSVVEGVLTSLSASFDLKGVGLIKELGTGMDRVGVDRGRLESLTANLVKNALEATSSGGRVVVRLEKDIDAALLVLEVADTGTSIVAPEFLSSNQPKKGTGVGLLAAKRIAISHGGDISLGPSPEGGMLARFTMPVGDEERSLAMEMPFWSVLSNETRMALKAAAHFRWSGDSDTGRFLDRKAVELESGIKLNGYLTRQSLLPKALWILNCDDKPSNVQSLLEGHLRKIMHESPDDILRLTSMSFNMLKTISRGKWSQSDLDLFGLGLTLALFSLPFDGSRLTTSQRLSQPLATIDGLGDNDVSSLVHMWNSINDVNDVHMWAVSSLRILSRIQPQQRH